MYIGGILGTVLVIALIFFIATQDITRLASRPLKQHCNKSWRRHDAAAILRSVMLSLAESQ
jgi:hypothetical protein